MANPFKYTVIKSSTAEDFEKNLNQCGGKELVATHISSHEQAGAAMIHYVAVMRETLSSPGRSFE